MTSDALIAMIERKLKAHGIKKVIPDDKLLGEVYRAFHRSNELREEFEELESEFEESKIKVPKNLKNQVRAVLEKHPDLRWDDPPQVVLDETQLERVRENKKKQRAKAGNFIDGNDYDEVAEPLSSHRSWPTILADLPRALPPGEGLSRVQKMRLVGPFLKTPRRKLRATLPRGSIARLPLTNYRSLLKLMGWSNYAVSMTCRPSSPAPSRMLGA